MNLPTLHSLSVTLSINPAKNPRGSSACRRDMVFVLVVAHDVIRTLTKIKNHSWYFNALGPRRQAHWKIIWSASLRFAVWGSIVLRLGKNWRFDKSTAQAEQMKKGALRVL
jgi:hypothetical protein